MRHSLLPLVLAPIVVSAFLPSFARADGDDLAPYFGFDDLEVVKIDPNAGPFIVADMNQDGLNDLVVVNNSKSRVEIHYQKAGAKPTDEVAAPTRVNELPEHWRFRREYVSVAHAITGIEAFDFDNDGLMDLVYAGQPGTIGFLRQTKPGTFELVRKVPVKGLAASPNGFAIADLIGDSKKDVAAIVNGRLTVWPLDGTNLGDSKELSVGSDALVAIVLGDYDGDGTTDVAGIIPDNPAPVRLWLGTNENGVKGLGSQVRFEMPPLREATALQLPGKKANALAVIEKPSRRTVVYELEKAAVEESGTRDAPLTVWGFSDAGNRKRSIATVDVDGDGLLDVLATNTQDNAVVLWKQAAGKGLQPPVNFPAYADLDSVVAADVDGDKSADIFLLSEKEGVIGRTKYVSSPTGGAIPFPQAMTVAAGHVPVVQSLVKLDEGARLAVVAKDGRNFVLELLPLDGSPAGDPIKLGSLSKQPDAIVAIDADRDGKTDLLLFTADKPMIMLRGGTSGSGADAKPSYTMLESKDMGQFGLVQAANDKNTAVWDLDGDGKPELLVADKNFIRALRYDEKPAGGASPGWQVAQQVNAQRGDAKLVSITVVPPRDGSPARLVAADRENNALLVFAAEKGASDGRWTQTDVLNVTGFKFSEIHAGSYSGDGKEDILAIGDDGFAIVRLEGQKLTLSELGSWRSDSTRRVHHEIVPGDVNGDGRLDLVLLDAGEQMADILTFTDAGRLLYATGFRVFESRMFSGGEPKEFEPSMGFIVDVTGDKADDLVLLCHDRILLYPQMTKASAAAAKP
ncbi:MAG: VCBS repeat-containing protein [Phycisphaerales bacterium]